MHHRDFIKNLTSQQRQELTKKNNSAASIRLILWLAFVLFWAVLILGKVKFWPVYLLPLGIMLVFLFSLMHETTHKTAFANPYLNSLVANCCGVLILLPPHWFKAFHFEHHRHTQDEQKDPENLYPKPENLPMYIKLMSGVPVGCSLIAKLLSNARGRCKDNFVAVEDRKLIQTEAQCMLLFYVSVALLSILMGSYLALILWVLPLLLGQAFLRLFLLAEHNGCAISDNMFENTRTTITHPLVRFLSWNMSYHAEHHVLPSVPFHQLPRFHILTSPHLKIVQAGYWQYHLSVIRQFNLKKQ